MNRFFRVSILGVLFFLQFAIRSMPTAVAEPVEITLNDAVIKAVQHSPSLRSGFSTVRAAVEREAEAETSRYPRLSLSAGYFSVQQTDPLELTLDLGGTPQTISLGDTITDSITASAEITQPLYTGGAINAAIDTAGTRRQVSEAELLSQRRDLLLSVRSAYWRLVEATEQVSAIEDRLTQVEKATEDMRNRAAAGFVTRSNVLALEMQQAQVELQLIRATNGRRIAAAHLALLTGLPTDADLRAITLLPAGDDSGTGSGKNRQLSLEELSSRTLENRADLAVLRLAVTVRQAQIRTASSQRLPSFYLSGQVTVSRPAPDTFPSENSFGATWKAGVLGRYELGDQFGVAHSIGAAENDLETALATLAAAEEVTLFEVQRAYLEWITAQEEVRAAQTIVRRSEENLSETQSRVAGGAALQADELDAEAELLEARLTLTGARVNRQIAWETLLRATGEIEEGVSDE